MFGLFNKNKKKRKVVLVDGNVETWVVRWNVRYGKYSDNYKEVSKFFLSKQEAKEIYQKRLDNRKAKKVAKHEDIRM